ncbi:MAG: hypothetical protein A2086_01710 [Spirochaetes bacterium GWD1_27_9]|nr:MAG: hypothetical protein A2Z98_04020 [Spirochaetes bacterium GWB1_27_13]OHD20614.1 MAG: hypothetical protein A2Y34_17500 [Spirochaetes bacterium GWC1_27_15]OHD41819.1 MAG: hypothetical protein A2086_01710 [Spirochaetes bacterium GWD1_27_9]
MGTRGLWGFYKNGINKLTYNHFDSYPSYLGKTVVTFVKHTSIEELNQIFEKIILIDEFSTPTEEQIKECEKYSDLTPSDKRITDWYCLLRDTQGNPDLYKSDLRFMINSNDFITDSLFCEWAYIINLTDNVLEVYKGVRKRPNSKNNRHRLEKPKNKYYACEKIIEFPLNKIEDNWQLLINKQIKKA